jgi:hypothetical protein
MAQSRILGMIKNIADSRSTICGTYITRGVMGWSAEDTCEDVLRRAIASAQN